MSLYSLKNKSSNLLVYIYIISASIAFISKIGNSIVNPAIQYGIFLFWIIIALVKWGKNNFKLSEEELSIKDFFLIFMIPKIIIHIYSIILFTLGKTEYITRNTKSYLIIFSVFAVIYIFSTSIIRYTIIAACISYFLVIFYDITVYGITTIPHTIAFLLTDNIIYNSSAGLYEVHDYTFAIGYIVLYYVLIKEKFTKKDLMNCYIFIIFIFMGLKRIEILAIILVILFVLITKFISNKYRFYKITSYTFIIVAYIYIYMLSSSKFFELLNKFNVNTMGRNYYYKAIIDLCEFSPKFLGFGRNAVSNLLMSDFSYMKVDGVHSDILKYYAECGFILFGIWMWYFLVKIVKWINAKYSFRVVFCYYVLTLYSFIIYYTDNIDTYFISQFIYMMIVSVMALRDKKDVIK